MCRSFLVSFLYSFVAASNIEVKLEIEGWVGCLLVDIWIAIGSSWIAVRNKLVVGNGRWVEGKRRMLSQHT